MNNLMQKEFFHKLVTSGRVTVATVNGMNPEQKKQLEKGWDVEHAYYSSALEGSKLDRKEFEKMAEKAQ